MFINMRGAVTSRFKCTCSQIKWSRFESLPGTLCYVLELAKTLYAYFFGISPPLGEGGTPHKGLYREAPPEKDTFFTLQVHKRVGISQVEVYKRVGKLAILVFKMAFNYGCISLFIKHYMKIRARLLKEGI